MRKLTIGLQLYTLRDYCKNPKDIAQTLKKVREIGYRVVQLSALGPIDIKELKNILDSNGLYACSTHTSYERLLNQLNKVIEEHKILGAEAIMCPGLPRELHNPEGYLKVAKELAKVIDKAKKNNLIVGYHNHSTELEKYNGKTGLEIILEACPSLEAEIDTYWVQHGGGDPVLWIQKYSGRVSEVHVKDFGIKNNQQIMAPIGEGNLNWPKILDACEKAGSRYCLVEQDTCQIDPFESAKISFNNMKSWGLKVNIPQ